jgi:hypothetical protein
MTVTRADNQFTMRGKHETLCVKSLMPQELQIIKPVLESNTQLLQSLSTSLRWCIDDANAALRGILILSQDVDE